MDNSLHFIHRGPFQNRLYALPKDSVKKSIQKNGKTIHVLQKGVGIRSYNKVWGAFLTQLGFAGKVAIEGKHIYVNKRSLVKFQYRGALTTIAINLNALTVQQQMVKAKSQLKGSIDKIAECSRRLEEMPKANPDPEQKKRLEEEIEKAFKLVEDSEEFCKEIMAEVTTIAQKIAEKNHELYLIEKRKGFTSLDAALKAAEYRGESIPCEELTKEKKKELIQGIKISYKNILAACKNEAKQNGGLLYTLSKQNPSNE